MKLIIGLILIALAASRSTIPELYKKNNGYFTSDYSTTYDNPVKAGEFGVTSEAGDINNDGIPDFILGNPTNDNSKGIAYVIYGKKGSLRQFNNMNDFQPSDGFIIKGNTNGQKLGFSLGAAGDLNGDGIDDIIISSPFWNRDSYATEVGMIHVLYGRRSSSEFPSVIDVDRLPSSQGFKIFGESSQGRAGFSVSGAGDVNGDGLSDIIIGAFGLARAYVIYGSKQGLTDMTLPPAAGKGFTVYGDGQQHFGNSVSKVGDFNGDGVDDLIIGAHVADQWTGSATIIFGRRGGFPATVRASEGMLLTGAKSGDNFGCTVSGAGDFNGDGLQDVIIGAYAANGGKGASYVIFGTRQVPSTLSMNNLGSRGFNVMSSAISQLGLTVSGGRDLNGDGRSDVVMGAPAWNKENGGVYILYGYSASSYGNIWLDNLQASQGFAMFGTQEGSRYGHFVRVLKDINQDGQNDFIVGAFTANGGKGAANLFYLPWKCMTQCSTCSKIDTCDSCASGLGFLNGDCVNCPQTTHFLSNGVCIMRCSANCARCSKPNTCDSCAQGFGLLNNYCQLCPGNTHTLSNGICVERRPENCRVWSGPEICDVCQPSYGLLHNKCQICPAETHFLNNGVCSVKCSANCARCSTPNTCETCSQNFGFLEGKCITCPSATHLLDNGRCIEKRPANCVMWSGPEFCYQCAPGFGFLNSECVTCNSETHILSNGHCKVRCSENCARCSQSNTCDICTEGYGFFNGNCQVCPSETHILSDGHCKVKCTENCAQCTKPNECDFCAESFGLLDHACVTCPNTHLLNNGFCVEIKDPFKQIKDFFGGWFN